MKLQVNTSGAWKQVMHFGIADIERAKAAAIELASISANAYDKPVTWRIVDSTDTPVLVSTTQLGWHTPHWMEGREIVP